MRQAMKAAPIAPVTSSSAPAMIVLACVMRAVADTLIALRC